MKSLLFIVFIHYLYTPFDFVSFHFKCQRFLLAQLRTGTLTLALEVGRFTNIKEEDRLCDLGKTENKSDFLLWCPCCKNLRKSIFDVRYEQHSRVFWNTDLKKKKEQL